jgi:YihY family inner membrane protein
MFARAWSFLRRVFRAFRHNQGILLSGAVAYYTLLSIVPLFAVLLAVLSHFMDRRRLLEVLTENLELVIDGQARAITAQVGSFLDASGVVGVVGGVVVLFFSSMAFTVLESAMQVIFFHRVVGTKRHFLVSALIPYVFIMALGLGLGLITAISGALDVLSHNTIHALGRTVSLVRLPSITLHALGVVGMALLFTALYLVMPVGRMKLRHALAGGVTAALLWEVVRYVLVWYFTRLSMVNLIYGSFATTIIVLLTLEAASLILLFGAQVIAELERDRLPRDDQGSADEDLHVSDTPPPPEAKPDATTA